MKNKIFKTLLFVMSVTLLIVLSACNNKTVNDYDNSVSFEDTEYVFETDWQYYYGTGDLKTNVTCSPNGYYTCAANGFVRFIDAKTLKATPLCAKANCDHTDKDFCDAYIENLSLGGVGFANGTGTSSILQYYNGKLYFLIGEENDTTMSTDQYLESADPDGKNKRKATDKLDFGSNISSWLIHRGYFYAVASSGVYRVNLENKAEEEVFVLENFINGTNNIHSVMAYGNDMYIKYDNIKADESGDLKSTGEYLTVHLDLNTLQSSQCSCDGKEVYIVSFLNGRVLAYCIDKEEYMADYYLCDTDFTEFEKVTSLPVGETLTTDGKYYYIENGGYIQIQRFQGNEFKKPEGAEDYYGQTVKIYDMKMNEVDSFIIPSKKPYDTFAAQSPNDFILFLPVDGSENKYSVSVIEKSKIGSFNGNAAELTDVGEWREYFRR